MTRQELFKAELADLLKEHKVSFFIDTDYGGYPTGVVFTEQYFGQYEDQIDFTLSGMHFDHENLIRR